MKKIYRMKKHFFAVREGLPELQRAINSQDKEEIKKLIVKNYEHLQKIFQICNLLD